MPAFLMNRYVIEAIAVVLAAVGMWIWWQHHDAIEKKLGEQQILQADKDASTRQKAVDDAKIKLADDTHAKEITDIQATYNSKSVTPNVVCRATPSSVPTTTVPSSTSGPTGDGKQSNDVHPDITGALQVFARRLDILNADARELNAEIR